MSKIIYKKVKKFEANLSNSINNLFKVAKENKWQFRYDKEEDILYFSASNLSDNFILMPLATEDMCIRVNSEGLVEGFVIDDFKSLFVPENEELKDFAEILTKNSSMEKEKRAYFNSLIFIIRRLKLQTHNCLVQ